MQKSKSNTVLADYFPAPVPEKLLIFTGVPEKKKTTSLSQFVQHQD